MSTKMLWELRAPEIIARVKEDFSVNNIWKYLRYYRMYIERFALYHKKTNLTRRVENLLFWRGKVAFVKDVVFGLVVAEIDREETNPNGVLISVDVSAENGYKRKNLKVGKDVVVLYADETHIAPVLYIWAIANEIVDREDIIRTQDNMLRKPILVKGVGEDFDNALVKASNVLSGVAWFNEKSKKGKDNVMSSEEMEVLNLQVGNAYKGAELWDSRKHFDELLCDYVGYVTVKNEKRERVNTLEVENENSVGRTFYKSAVRLHEDCVKEIKEVFGEQVEFKKMLEIEEEVKEDGGNQKNMERTSDE